MRVAITSTGNSLESKLDKRFGRCSYFVIFDTETKAMEYIPNPNIDIDEGSGSASVHLLVSRDVKKVVSGEFGIKVKPLLDSHRVQMIVIKEDITVSRIIDLLNHYINVPLKSKTVL